MRAVVYVGMMTGNTDLDVDAARTAYADASARLAVLCQGLFVDSQDAADALLSLADEVGADEAVSRLLQKAEQFGVLQGEVTGAVIADVADGLEDALEASVVAQDRLDLATSRREAGLRPPEPGRPQVINIGGREFVIDAGRRELRAVDNPTERYELGFDAVAGASPPEQSLTEQAREQTGVRPAQSKPTRGPDRPR